MKNNPPDPASAQFDWLFVYGPPGSGKSSLGCCLAGSLCLPFYDLDEAIQARAGQSIPEIFETQGEPGFRRLESLALLQVLEMPPGVVALGGGALLDESNHARVESAGRVLCLAAPFETLLSRLAAAGAERPLVSGDLRPRLAALIERRAAHYASFSLQLDASQGPPESLAWQAQVELGFFHVSGMGVGYDVRIVEGGLDQLGQALRSRGLGGPLALVSDDQVSPLYASGVLASLRVAGYSAQVFAIPAGEAHKTIDSVMSLWDGFLNSSLERGSTVIALGGGVVGDLAGFAAATYLRGVRWVAVPTSLLAMVDASLGGKTGVDLPQGKNLVGAFHPPSLVFADPLALATLPSSELRNGLAEVVKHGVIGDPQLFALCSQGWQVLQDRWLEIVRRGMAVKVRVIQEDPYEKGCRASLNLGHTLGHALEVVSSFRLKHGEAVSIGMVAAARLSERLGIARPGLASLISATLVGLGLPVEIPPGLDPQSLILAMGVDKKRSAGKVRFVLPVEIGEVNWGVEVADRSMILEG